MLAIAHCRAMSRKRRLEIECPSISEVVEAEPTKEPPTTLRLKPKKLKSRKSSESAYHIAQEQSHGKMMLSRLMNIEERASKLEKEEIEEEIRSIVEMMQSPQNGFLRSKAAAVLATVLASAQCLPAVVSEGVEELLMQLKRDDSWDVKSQVVLALAKVAPHVSEMMLVDELTSVAKAVAAERHHGIRASALRMICSLAMREGDTLDTQILLSQFAQDCDARVRQAALSSLLQLHTKGFQLSVLVYDNACKCLKDDNEDVRLKALQIVQIIGVTFPDKLVPLQNDSSTEIRLVDDAFVKTCDMVNDLSMQVRAQASRHLGLFKGVKFQFLEQTLDKKLMSHLKKKKTEHEMRKERHATGKSAGGWESGRQWGSNWSKTDLNPDEVSLMNQGACGAFVHGLEDEYLEVRMASLEALCQLGIEFPQFAVLSLDFLVDMFNDEIDTVRLNAIEVLRHVISSVELREDQLETILSVLLDSSSDIREAIRMLLGSCYMNSKPALDLTISSLLSNLARYPQDRLHIWMCMKELGQHHGSLAFALLPQLLNTHPYFSAKEPDIEDPAYIGVLILVFNAAHCYPTIGPLFPQHTVRHYPYLRGSLPDLVPCLELKPSHGTIAPVMSASSDSALELIAAVVDKARMVSTCGDLSMVQTVLESAASELKQLSELSRCVQGVAECSSLYVRCQLLLLKAFRPWLNWTDSLHSKTHMSSSSLLTSSYSVQMLLELSYTMQYGYGGLSVAEQAAIMEIRLLAHVYQLLSHSHILVSSKNESRYQQIPFLFDRLQLYEKLCKDGGIDMSTSVRPLVFAKAVYSGKEAGSLLQSLQQALERVAKEFVVQTLQFSPHTCGASAEILIPQRDSERVVEFVSSLAMAIPVEAVIDNVSDMSLVCIQVVFPDGKQQTFHPKLSEFRALSDTKSRLRTAVVLSHSNWSEKCKIQVSVALMYAPDLDEAVLFNMREQQSEGTTNKASLWSSNFAFVELCTPVAVHVLPKEKLYR